MQTYKHYKYFKNKCRLTLIVFFQKDSAMSVITLVCGLWNGTTLIAIIY